MAFRPALFHGIKTPHGRELASGQPAPNPTHKWLKIKGHFRQIVSLRNVAHKIRRANFATFGF